MSSLLSRRLVNMEFQCWANAHYSRHKCLGIKIATVIFKFSRRKDCQQQLAFKNDNRKINMENVDLPGQNKLFINKNLC